MPTPCFAFHVLARPAATSCNRGRNASTLESPAAIFPGSDQPMDDEMLEQYIRQYITAEAGDVVTLAWQGSEPMLRGLDFFRRAVALTHHYARPGVTVEHTIQTNGALLDDAWCEFLRDNNFLVELRIEGPSASLDVQRMDQGGPPIQARVPATAALLRAHRVDFNTLTCVDAADVAHPLEVYRFLRDKVGSEWVQFIPVVEQGKGEADEDVCGPGADEDVCAPGADEDVCAPGADEDVCAPGADEDVCAPKAGSLQPDRAPVGRRPVTAQQWGEFLCTIYDEWVRCDVGRIYVNLFEAALASWLGAPQPLCIFRERCGDALALEQNGDLYCCERYVDAEHLLGNIRLRPLADLVTSPQQQQFGAAKAVLPEQCCACTVRFACHGECPKNRLQATGEGKPPINALCAGYFHFFTHIDRTMRVMAQLYRMGRPPAEVMALLAAEDARYRQAAAALRRSAPCPCGSGKKVKQCHGQA